MGILAAKRVLLGVTGGIAAYKSPDLVRRLREAGAEVRVVMTRGAGNFITPLTMQAVSGQPVHSELLDPAEEAAMGHIRLARWADIILVAPASANFMARFCHGLADDLLATLCLAADVPIVLAPAMNHVMWNNAATRDNAGRLAGRGVKLLGPGDGDQACGETGPGRMLEPAQLVTGLAGCFEISLLSGLKVVVTAGPTREAIDPVRYISNRSSGRMGYAVARAAREAGAAVTLVSGPVAIDAPDRVRCIRVQTAREMYAAALADARDAAIFIAAAAVADYRCAEVASQKMKKRSAGLSIMLEPNPDILAEVAALEPHPFTVGFAAETESVRQNALKKLQGKRLDMVAANEVGADLGFEREDNALEVFWRNGSRCLDRAPKEKLARQLIALVAERFHATRPDKTH